MDSFGDGIGCAFNLIIGIAAVCVIAALGLGLLLGWWLL
jgi:hypothetical protein